MKVTVSRDPTCTQVEAVSAVTLTATFPEAQVDWMGGVDAVPDPEAAAVGRVTGVRVVGAVVLAEDPTPDGPLDTARFTLEPGATKAPSEGVVLITLPAGT